MKSNLITWHGPEETWTWPFTQEQQLKLSSIPCLADGIIQIYAIGPEYANLILSYDPNWHLDFVDSDIGTTWKIRFGQIQLEDFNRLPEHTGW